MPEAITVRIGGEGFTVPLIMNFATLERAWPALKALGDTRDPLEQVSAGIAMLAAVLMPVHPELHVGEIKSRLRVNMADGTDERTGVMDAVNRLMSASGLLPKGEDLPPGKEPPAPAAAGISTSSTS